MGERNTAGGFKWRFKNDDEIVEISNKNDVSLLNSSQKSRTYVDNKKARAFYQLTRDDEILNKFISVKEASQKSNLKRSNISLCLIGEKQSAGGFKRRYADEMVPQI